MEQVGVRWSRWGSGGASGGEVKQVGVGVSHYYH